MEPDKNKVFPLHGKVQHYAWGGSHFIPQLLHLENKNGQPFAEYWMGTHRQANSEITLGNGLRISLNEYIRNFPRETL